MTAEKTFLRQTTPNYPVLVAELLRLEGTLRLSSTPTLLTARSPRAGCPQLCPAGVSPRMFHNLSGHPVALLDHPRYGFLFFKWQFLYFSLCLLLCVLLGTALKSLDSSLV